MSASTSLRLEIDGSVSHILESDAFACPQVEIPPFLASVSSIHTDQTEAKQRKQKRKRHDMTLKRYNFLCGNILAILVVESAILLSILTIMNCSFYTANILDESGESFVYTIGLFRYSWRNESSGQRQQCVFYGSNSTSYLDAVTEVLKNSQDMAIIAPCLAAIVCISLAVKLFRYQTFCGRWKTTLVLLTSTLFQLLVILCFDGDLAW